MHRYFVSSVFPSISDFRTFITSGSTTESVLLRTFRCSGFIPEPLIVTAFLEIVAAPDPLSQAFALDLPRLLQILEGRSPR